MTAWVYNRGMKKIFCYLIVFFLFASPLFAQIIDLRGTGLITTSGPYTKWVSKYKGAVLWETNFKSTSMVRWGKDESYGRVAKGLSGTKHQVKLAPLKGGTTYHYMVISKTEDGEAVESGDHIFTTPTPDISVKAAYFPKVLRLGGTYDIGVVTMLYDEPLDAPYTIKIYRKAYDKSGELLGEVLLGEAQVKPHPIRTNRTTSVRIVVKPLPGLKEAFQAKDVFIVKIEAQEKEDNLDNNQLKKTIEVVHS